MPLKYKMRREEGGPSHKKKFFLFSFYEVRNKRSTLVCSMFFAGCTASFFERLTVKKPTNLVVRLKKNENFNRHS